MKIGISVKSSFGQIGPADGAKQMIERAAAAKAADLDSLFVGDHHATASPYYQNNVILARMLAHWGDKPFGALYLLPLWHPVLLAEQIGTLASLGSGPFIMQCGLGDARQGAAMGVDMSKRVGMFVSSLNLMRALWRGETVNEDKYWGISNARISPLPAYPVDVWVGAMVDNALRRTAKMAEGWLASPGLTPRESSEAILRYQQHCAEFDRVPTASALRRDIFVGATAEEARRVVQPYLDKGYRGMSEDALLFGSVEQVAEQISVFADQGYSDIIVRNLSDDQSESLSSIERLGDVKKLL